MPAWNWRRCIGMVLGTEPDLHQAEWRFQNAYSGFVVLEEKKS